MTTYVYNEHDENQGLTMRNKLKKKAYILMGVRQRERRKRRAPRTGDLLVLYALA